MSEDQADAPVEEETKPKAKKAAKRGDPWEEPCPVCGLLGCRRHA